MKQTSITRFPAKTLSVNPQDYDSLTIEELIKEFPKDRVPLQILIMPVDGQDDLVEVSKLYSSDMKASSDDEEVEVRTKVAFFDPKHIEVHNSTRVVVDGTPDIMQGRYFQSDADMWSRVWFSSQSEDSEVTLSEIHNYYDIQSIDIVAKCIHTYYNDGALVGVTPYLNASDKLTEDPVVHKMVRSETKVFNLYSVGFSERQPLINSVAVGREAPSFRQGYARLDYNSFRLRYTYI